MKSPIVARYEKLATAIIKTSLLGSPGRVISRRISRGITMFSLHHCKEKWVSISDLIDVAIAASLDKDGLIDT